MFKVSELCVTSDDEHVRGNARQVVKSEREDMKERGYEEEAQVCLLGMTCLSQAVVQFMMDYPLGKKLNKYLDFFIANLRFSLFV